jgi:hypothetical protein
MSMGVFLDPKTKNTTYVTPLEPAEPILKDLINIKSEADLTRALHTFLQKLSYAPRCRYTDDQGDYCEGGHLSDGSICPSCKGTGVEVHGSTQDVILIKLPDSMDDFVPLKDLVHYVNLPEWLPKWQDEKLDKALKMVSKAVFNTEVFDVPQFNETATSAIIEWEKIYLKLEPYAQKYSEVLKHILSVIAQYIEKFEGLEVIHAFPKDFKMKSIGELMLEYKTAKESGAPNSVLEAIEHDILRKQNANDPEKVSSLSAQNSFLPFKDKAIDEVVYILSQRDNLDRDKILYENFDRIFFEIHKELENPFHLLTYERQREVVEAKIAEIAEQIQYKQGLDLFGEEE